VSGHCRKSSILPQLSYQLRVYSTFKDTAKEGITLARGCNRLSIRFRKQSEKLNLEGQTLAKPPGIVDSQPDRTPVKVPKQTLWG
jgi:hypothetical protein